MQAFIIWAAANFSLFIMLFGIGAGALIGFIAHSIYN
jgi:hypothetical protein